MRRGLQFRHRIGLLVALAAAGLVSVTIVTLLLGRQSQRQLEDIQTRYVPLIELDRDLDATFGQIPRVLEDAAAAAEESGIDEADQLSRELVRRIRAGSATITDNGGDPRALQAAFDAYYKHARAVSSAMVRGTPVAQVADQIEAMRSSQQTFATLLAAATTPDRSRLAAAFSTARSSQQAALRIEIIVGVTALALMVLLSWGIIRRTVKSLNAVAAGVQRLASGELGQEIEVTTDDEFGHLAREANRTAVRLREARDALEQRAEELARASRYKSEFLANMSHELRTPLNSILVLSQLLATGKDGPLTAKQVEFANVIRRSGEELLALIDEVLDLAKVEAGKQSLVVGVVSIAELQAYVRKMFGPVALQKGVQLEVECADDVPAEIRTDWTRLAQILKNLVANAIKFTAKGAITVRIARPVPEQIRISVSDTGIGIAADKQVWIFEAFAQAETGTSRTFGGTGLGLTIARQLAIRLGGELTVESELGRGSTFHLVVPIAGPPDVEGESSVEGPSSEPSGPALAHEDDAALAGKTVLLVHADMRTVYSLSAALRAKHLEVIAVADGPEAVEEIRRHPAIDLVLCDSAAALGELGSLPVIELPPSLEVADVLQALRTKLSPRDPGS